MKKKDYKTTEGWKTIEGEFIIEDGNFYIDKRELKDDEIVRLPIKTLKLIIADAKDGII